MPERDDSAQHPQPWKNGNPWLAGVLAYLLPGAGHLYQGRHFKAAIYSVCILGSFFYGTSLAGWQAVSYDHHPPKGMRRARNWGYIAQVGAGLPTLTSYVQSSRYAAQRDGEVPVPETMPLIEPIAAEFDGEWTQPGEDPVAVSGRLELSPVQDELGSPIAEGRFVGTTITGEPVEIPISGDTEIEPAIYGRKQRLVEVDVDGTGRNRLEGSVPRPFLDWYQVPLETREEQALHQRFGKTYELALVYTWIAGLLNVLAVWDCVEGPAYGYGDEPEEDDEPGEKAKSTPTGESPQTAEASA